MDRAIDIERWRGDERTATGDAVAVEEPLEIRVRRRAVSVTMRTPGHDAELAVGFLLGEGLIRGAADVLRVEPCGQAREGNVVNVTLAPRVAVDFDKLTRHVFASSSCGLCGKASIDALHQWFDPIDSDLAVPAALLRVLPDNMRAAQATFERTGGLHAAALFDERGGMTVLREDVGRHNAVDKALGHAVLRGVALDRAVLLVSGRASFEVVQKAWAGRVPVVCAVSAPTSLAVELARESGVTLVGFLRGDRMNVYSGGERVRSAAVETKHE